jgi:hypothetical protein
MIATMALPGILFVPHLVRPAWATDDLIQSAPVSEVVTAEFFNEIERSPNAPPKGPFSLVVVVDPIQCDV